MAIKKLPESTEHSITLSFDNGDLQALKDVIGKFNFKDEEAALRFALFVLLKSEDNGVTVTEGGNPTRYVPSQSSLKEEENGNSEQKK
jgi:hypothetical protein